MRKTPIRKVSKKNEGGKYEPRRDILLTAILSLNWPYIIQQGKFQKCDAEAILVVLEDAGLDIPKC